MYMHPQKRVRNAVQTIIKEQHFKDAAKYQQHAFNSDLNFKIKREYFRKMKNQTKQQRDVCLN